MGGFLKALDVYYGYGYGYLDLVDKQLLHFYRGIMYHNLRFLVMFAAMSI